MPDHNVLFDNSCHRSSLGHVPAFINATDIKVDVKCFDGTKCCYRGVHRVLDSIGVLGNLVDNGEFASKRRLLPDLWWDERLDVVSVVAVVQQTGVQLGNHHPERGALLSGADPQFSPLPAEAQQEFAQRVCEILLEAMDNIRGSKSILHKKACSAVLRCSASLESTY